MEPTEIIAWSVAVVAVLMLFGQYLAGQSDYFLSIENPRPLDPNNTTITVRGWGFASASRHNCIAELAGQGFADVRVFATRRQVLLSFITFGFVRRVSIAWRGNAGQHPLGEA
jgi:hypothetical protein